MRAVGGARTVQLAACSVLLLLAIAGTADAFLKTPPAVPGDIKYIKCQVCELLAKNVLTVYKDVKEAKGKQFKEEDLIDALERVTDPVEQEGQWISRIDLQEQGDRLVPVEMPEQGECGSECKTVRKAAEQILGDHDTDVAEKLFKTGMSRAQLTNWMCYKLTSACINKAPPLPKDRAKGPEFKVMDADAASVQSTLASMKKQGLGGEVFTRDEAIKKYMDLSSDEDLEDMDIDDLPKGIHDDVIKGAKGPDAQQPARGQKPADDPVGKVLDQVQIAMETVKGTASKLVGTASGLVGKATDFVKGFLNSAPQAEL